MAVNTSDDIIKATTGNDPKAHRFVKVEEENIEPVDDIVEKTIEEPIEGSYEWYVEKCNKDKSFYKVLAIISGISTIISIFAFIVSLFIPAALFFSFFVLHENPTLNYDLFYIGSIIAFVISLPLFIYSLFQLANIDLKIKMLESEVTDFSFKNLSIKNKIIYILIMILGIFILGAFCWFILLFMH